MKILIDKSALAAEIERRRKEWRNGSSTESKFKREECDDILSLLDTLEVKIEPVSDDLEEAARNAGQKYFPDKDNIWARPNYEAMAAANAFKAGAQWQEEQCQKTIELAEDHAYLAGQEKVIEKACEFIETYPHLFMGVLRSEVIEDFKNYMKG